MVNWRALEAACDAKVVAGYSELVRHSPMKNGVADPTRTAREIRGLLHTPAAAGAVSLGDGMMTTLAASEGALVVERAAYADVAFAVKDKIRALELPGTPAWEVRIINDRFSSIVVLVLTQA